MSSSGLLQLKRELIEKCRYIIDERILEQRNALGELQQSSNVETKSSAGDKYETGRAMIHLEKEKIASQLDTYLKLRKVIGQISDRYQSQIGLGSVIKTDKGIFFLSVALGEVKVSEQVICLSPVAPLGKTLASGAVGDLVEFNKVKYQILDNA